MLSKQLPASFVHDICDEMVVSANKDYRVILLEELELRCKRNSRYSLRAFAKFLGLTSARLSEIMNRKSGLSRDVAVKIAKRLDFTDQEIEIFGDLVESEHARSPLKRKFARLKLQKYLVPEYVQLQLDAFKVISDWYCFAILELAKVKEFQSNHFWIAKALGITPVEVKTAIERLERLNLLETINGVFVPTGNFSTNASDIPSDSVKKFHQQILEKALSSLFIQPTGKRDYSALVLGIDSSRLSEAKALIKEFRRDFDQRMGESEVKDEVYCLSMQFFNLAPALEEMK